MTNTYQSSLAVLIDYENLALGTGKRKRNGHQEAGPRPDVKRILERLVDKGRITAKRAIKAILPHSAASRDEWQLHNSHGGGIVIGLRNFASTVRARHGHEY